MSGTKVPSLPKGKEKPCVVTFATQSDRSNEPPPQPRVRKVTTIINTLGVVVRNTTTEIGVWVFTSCVEVSFPRSNSPIFSVSEVE